MIPAIFKEADIVAYKDWMKNHNRFVILTHLSPDGDALGSSLAMLHYLLNRGKEAVVIVPNAFPAFFRWMPRVRDIIQYDFHKEQADALIDEADAIFCMDFNVPKRMDEVGKKVAESGKPLMLIDHHPYPDTCFDLSFSQPKLCATCEVLFRIWMEAGEEALIDRDTATCLYTGLMTDTGAFTYNSIRPEIFEVVARLLTLGVDKDMIYRRVFHSCTIGRMQLMGYTLCEKMKIYPIERAALITLTQEELKRYGYVKGDTEGFVNMPLQIKGIQFACFLREDKTMIKVSLRSVGSFSCTEFATEIFGGGGHRNASGGECREGMDKAIARFEEGLKKYKAKLER
jgi:phosphoesterase RecJ-like protein